jgi:hypothetical protein
MPGKHSLGDAGRCISRQTASHRSCCQPRFPPPPALGQGFASLHRPPSMICHSLLSIRGPCGHPNRLETGQRRVWPLLLKSRKEDKWTGRSSRTGTTRPPQTPKIELRELRQAGRLRPPAESQSGRHFLRPDTSLLLPMLTGGYLEHICGGWVRGQETQTRRGG